MSDSYATIEQLLELRRYAQAQRYVDALLAEAPADPDAHAYAARIAFGREDLVAAREHVEQTLAAEPDHFMGRVLLFHVRMADRAYADAELVIQQLIRENPQASDLFCMYGDLMLRTFHVERAERLADEALRLDPDSQDAKLQVVLVALIRGKRSRVDEQLADLIRDDPDSTRLTATLFVSFVGRRRYREALVLGQQLLRNDPENADLVDAVVDLRCQTHWVAWPAYPIVRFGWIASGVMWAVAIGLLIWAQSSGALAIVGPLWVGYILYCVYTWVYPPLLRRWIARRGV